MWFSFLVILIALGLIPVVWFLAKTIKHGIKDLLKSSLICLMITSLLELGFFWIILYSKIFFYMCKIGLNCQGIFSNFIGSFFYMTFFIFIIILSVYYALRALKKIFKVLFVIGGILLIILAVFFLINSPVSKEIQTDYCLNNSECILSIVDGEITAININYISEENQMLINESTTCIYNAICVEKKCRIELNENNSICLD